MKYLKLLAVLSMFSLSLAAYGQSLGNAPPFRAVNGFAASANITNLNAGLSWAVVTARSGNGGAPAVNYINAGTSNVNGVVIFYRVTAQAQETFTNSTVNLFVDSTNGFGTVQGDIVVIRHMLDDSYDRRVLTANTANTNLALTIAPNTTVPGDIIYRVTTNSYIAWGQVTNGVSAGGAPLYVGQSGVPLLVEIPGGATGGSINVVSGTFLPPVTVPRPGL
jgi:hypothetical protein